MISATGLFLAIGHQVHAVHARDGADLLDELGAQRAPLERLVVGAPRRSITASGMCTPGTCVRIHSAAFAVRSGPTPTRMKTLSSSPRSSTCVA